MLKWTVLLLCLLALASESNAQRRRHHNSSEEDDDDDDDEFGGAGWWKKGVGIGVICAIFILGAGAFSLCAFCVCKCHRRCRKDRVLSSTMAVKAQVGKAPIAPEWTNRLIIRPEFANKGFSELSEGFYAMNLCHLVRQRPGTDVTDGARWAVPMTSGKHLFEIIWPWGCRGKHATVGLGTRDAPVKGKGGVNLVGGNSNSWGLDIVQRRAIHNNKLVSACPSNGSYVPDRFLMYVDLDEGKLGFGCDVTFWGFVINNLPKGGQQPVFLMVGADKWQAQIQVYYRGSAGNASDTFNPGHGFILPPMSVLTAPGTQPLQPPGYNDAFMPPSPLTHKGNNPYMPPPPNKNGRVFATGINNTSDSGSDIFGSGEWTPEPPPTPRPTAPDHVEGYEPPPPYASPPPGY